MLVTVTICTRNRCASLARTLLSIERGMPCSCAWEVLVVDNGSTDGTQDVLAGFVGRLPIRVVMEYKAGLSNARNAATAAARGDYMVCTDDDVEVGANWLAGYADAFVRWPDVALFGGRIIPVLEQPVTSWFSDVIHLLEGPLAIRDLGREPSELRVVGNRIPFGANFAVSTHVQRLFPFDPNRGPGTAHIGDETTSFLAMLASGHKGIWLPEPSVKHLIGAERQNTGYVAWWFETMGRTIAWTGEEFLDGPRILGVPRWLWRRLFTRMIDYRVARLRSPPDVWIGKLISLSLDRGRVRHFHGMRTAPT